MTFFNYRNALVFFGIFTTMALAPATASAKGSVHIDVPGFSIGYHDYHYRGHDRRHYKRKYRRGYYKGYNRGYRNGYRNYDRGYYRSYPRKRGYYRGYNRGYDRGYNDNYCPSDTYSRYSYSDRSCYSHGDHFHCD